MNQSLDRPRLPLSSFAVAIVITGAIFAGFIWQGTRSFEQFRMLNRASIEAGSLIADIRHFDEVLATATGMAVETGDIQWKERYATYNARLSANFKRARDLATTPEIRGHARDAEEAHAQVRLIEGDAFDLVDGDQRELAREVLANPTYMSNRQIYNFGLEQLRRDLTTQAIASIAMEEADFGRKKWLFAVGIVLALAAWLHIFRTQVRFARENEALQGDLESRIEARTRELRGEIDQRRQAEAGVRQSRQLLRGLADNLPVFVSFKDLEGRFQFVNKVFEDWVGIGRDEVIGKTVHDVYEAGQAERFAEQDRRVAENREIISREARVSYPDGVVRDVIGTRFPVFSGSGEMFGIGTVNFDVTDRKRIEQEALEQNRLLQLTLESMGQGLTMYDGEWNLVMSNARYREHFDLPGDVFEGDVSFDDVVGATMRLDYDDEWRERLAVVRDPKRMTDVWRRSFERPSGRGLDLLSLPIEGGGFVVTSTDISERLRVEAELREARDRAETLAKTRADFVAVVSHEVRTPMNGVLGMAQLMREMSLSAEAAECLDVITSSGLSLVRIVDDLLDIAKFDADRLELERIPFRLGDVMDEAMRLMEGRFRVKGLAFSCEVAGDLPEILVGDPYRLRQILLNLISNACKFTDRGSVAIEVGSRVEAGDEAVLEFAVSDTGKGIGDEAREKLFSPYTQESVDVARKYGGTGLGLAICRRLVSVMGGEITLESEVGIGSTFRFDARFGIDREASSAELPWRRLDRIAETVGPLAPMRPLRVLQVEDNVINRQVVSRMLARAGHTVIDAMDGARALERLSEGDFDIVLMDRHMPEMSGLEATAAIRRLAPPLGRIPVLGITASALELEIQDCLDAGMDDVLSKPVDARTLIATIERLVGHGSVGGVRDVAAPAAGDAAPAVLDLATMREIFGEIDADAIEMLTLFHGSARDDLAIFHRAWAAGDDDDAMVRAHTLIGAARNAGAGELGDLFAAIEAALKSGDGATVEAAIAEIEPVWARLEDALALVIGD